MVEEGDGAGWQRLAKQRRLEGAGPGGHEGAPLPGRVVICLYKCISHLLRAFPTWPESLLKSGVAALRGRQQRGMGARGGRGRHNG